MESFLESEPKAAAKIEHVLSDWEAGGRQAAQAGADLENASTDKSHAGKDLRHSLKGIGHALRDFKHAMRDLSHLDEDLSDVIALAKKADLKNTLSEVKTYVATTAKRGEML